MLPAAPSVATRYEWEVGGVSVAGASGAQLTPRISGAYQVRACSMTRCGPWSALSAFVLATKVPTRPDFTVYPNPARTSLWVERPTAAPTATVELLGVTGRVVWHGTLSGGTQELPVQQLPAGFYLVRLRTATQIPMISRKVVEH